MALVGIALFGLVALEPALHAQFVLVDDHEIVRITLPGSAPPLSALVPMVMLSDPAEGRVRPAYWALRLAEATVFGNRPEAWHLAIFTIGVISAGLLYCVCRLVQIPRLPAALLGAWLLVAPGVSSVWVRLGTNETPATLFLVSSLLLGLRASRSRASWVWDTGFVVAALAAMLSKESFALAGPALAAFRVFADRLVHKPQTRPISAALVAVAGAVLMVTVSVVASGAGSQSYGGRFLSAPALSQYATDLLHNLAIILFATGSWLVLLMLFGVPRPSIGPSKTTATWATIAVALLVVPQLALYSRQGVIEGRYELPSALGVTILLMGILAWLNKSGYVRQYATGVAVFAVSVVAFAFSTWTYAAYFAEDSIQLRRTVARLAEVAAPSSVIGVAGDPAVDFEPMLALPDFFAAAGRSDLKLRVLPVEGRGDRGPRQVALIGEFYLTDMGKDSPVQTCAVATAVIVIHDASEARHALPCLADFKQVDHTERVLVWGGDHVSLRPRLPGVVEAGYSVLERPSAVVR